MITLGIAGMLVGVLDALTSFLPHATSLPFGVDTYITQGVGYYNFLAYYFPPMATIMTAFLAYLGFKVLMLTLRLLRIIR